MNKELFVSSTPHETKVGLVEDDLLAEVYLERENEYTLAGSIYKGRVTRVLPGMQSAFVDIGLERDAFLYVSDFMELEEHDEDLTDIVPANRGVQDLRAQPARGESAPGVQWQEATDAVEPEANFENGSGQDLDETEQQAETQPSLTSATPETPGGGPSQDRERGGWRGRRRRRGGRRDGRGDARGEGRERGSEPRSTRPLVESAPPPAVPRSQDSGRPQQFAPPAAYQPILLPGESISKYRGLTQTPVAQERHWRDAGTESSFASASVSPPAAPLAATFPDDEPIFASASAAPVAERPLEHHDESRYRQEDHAQASSSSAAATSVDWNRGFRRQDSARAGAATGTRAAAEPSEEFVEEDDEMAGVPEHSLRPASPVREPESTKKKRIRSAMKKRPMRDTRNLKKKREPSVSRVPRSGARSRRSARPWMRSICPL